MLSSTVSFLLKPHKFLFLKNNTQQQNSNTTFLLSPALTAFKLAFNFKFSFLFTGAYLLDILCYEIQQLQKMRTILCHVWAHNNLRYVNLTWSTKHISKSIESLFFNAKWLERETSEMSGWFFLNKRDKRVLFLIPIVFNCPLTKSHPVGGFFDMLLCPLTHKLTFRHQSWLS